MKTHLIKGKIKVLLVDDHPILRAGLSKLINQEADMLVCGEAEDGPKGFDLVGKLHPDVVVVDVSLKGGNGIELIKNLKASHPDLPMLVLSMHDETLYAERALRAGSRGYIMKEEAIEQVLNRGAPKPNSYQSRQRQQHLRANARVRKDAPLNRRMKRRERDGQP